jgi:hypothetical protein
MSKVTAATMDVVKGSAVSGETAMRPHSSSSGPYDRRPTAFNNTPIRIPSRSLSRFRLFASSSKTSANPSGWAASRSGTDVSEATRLDMHAANAIHAGRFRVNAE